ncbi:MAG: hypothetical protein H0W35_06405 [Actinobacteria bacterium]|nr:hypothetical protein [Actinomycetota bacterium]
MSETEVWTWLVSPHGVVHGSSDAMVFASTDVRYPVLRRLGVMREPAFMFPGTEIGDKSSSIFCIGTPNGYETIRTLVGRKEIVVALDRGTLPFGPLSAEPIALPSLWEMDAAWRHGRRGIAVALGRVDGRELGLPDTWNVCDVPLAS